MNNTTDISITSNETDQSSLLDRVTRELAMVILPVTIINAIESIVGIIGNVLIIIIYSRQYNSSNFRYFVLFMAITDLTSCSTCIPAEAFFQMNWYKLEHTWLCKTKAYFNVMTSMNSASLLLLFSFDRCRKICVPLRNQIRPKLAFKLCVGITFLSLILCLPVFFGWGKFRYDLPTDEGLVEVTVCGRSFELPDEVYTPLFNFYVYGIIALIIIITITNLITIQQLVCGKRLVPAATRQRDFLRDKKDQSNSYSVQTLSETLPSESDVSLSKLDNNASLSKLKINDVSPGTAIHTSENFMENNENISQSDENNIVALSQVELDEKKLSTNSKDVQCPKAKALSLVGYKTEATMENSEIKNPMSVISHSKLQPKKSKSGHRKNKNSRTKKLVIMFTLSMVFVFTMTIYMFVSSRVTSRLTNTDNPKSVMALYFFAWRLYFINYMVNPFLYGFMDQRFRESLKRMIFRK